MLRKLFTHPADDRAELVLVECTANALAIEFECSEIASCLAA